MPTAIRSLATVTATSREPSVGQEPVKGRFRGPRAWPRATARSDPRSMGSIPPPRCILRRGPTRATLGKREGPDWDGVTPAAWRRALVLGEIVPWAVCKEVEWRALALDAAWACPAVAWAVEWRAWVPDAAWACPLEAWVQGHRWPAVWAADSAALPWAGSVVIPVAGWADSAVHRWVEGSAAGSAAAEAEAIADKVDDLRLDREHSEKVGRVEMAGLLTRPTAFLTISTSSNHP